MSINLLDCFLCHRRRQDTFHRTSNAQVAIATTIFWNTMNACGARTPNSALDLIHNTFRDITKFGDADVTQAKSVDPRPLTGRELPLLKDSNEIPAIDDGITRVIQHRTSGPRLRPSITQIVEKGPPKPMDFKAIWS
ncbi:hypothetical protein DSM3645_14420 [Blastopirellula marina DSM 3645]|uniref:Uncharacterized protein n=1 Tax=Blastopirellula marina DSM 3645 TaxID=314230 RepID=A3ZS90_9BACT|nr:hypothetical protein DSM3645_14420 [Blastopirellula marina DSM 3645]